MKVPAQNVFLKLYTMRKYAENSSKMLGCVYIESIELQDARSHLQNGRYQTENYLLFIVLLFQYDAV